MAFVAQLTAAGADITANYGTYLRTMVEIAFMVFLMFILPKEIASSMAGSFGGKLTDIAGKLALTTSIMAGGGSGNSGGNTAGGTTAMGGGNTSEVGKAREVFNSGNPGGNSSSSGAADWHKGGGGGGSPSSYTPIPAGQWQQALSDLKQHS
jgi:hypothetical protein